MELNFTFMNNIKYDHNIGSNISIVGKYGGIQNINVFKHGQLLFNNLHT